MKRISAVLAGAIAAVAAVLFLRRRRPVVPAGPAAEPDSDPRADELRRRLAEARAAADDQADLAVPGEAAPATAAAQEEEPPPADEFEAMRRRVHAEARAAAEEMRKNADG